MREKGRRRRKKGVGGGLRGRLRSGAAHGGRFAAQRSPLVLDTAAAARGRAAAACGGRAARRDGCLRFSRMSRVRGPFTCAKRSAATAVQRRRTAKFLGSARQKCGCYGVVLAAVPMLTASVGPVGGKSTAAAARLLGPVSIPRAPTPPPPEVSTAADKSKQYGFHQNRVGADCGHLRDAAPCWGGAKPYSRLRGGTAQKSDQKKPKQRL